MSIPRKLLYFDTETSGLDPVKHGIWSMSGIIEIDGVVKERFDFRVKLFETDEIDPIALEMSPFSTAEDMRAIPNAPTKAYRVMISLFEKYINRYDRNDKFTLVGYNVKFDDDMLRSWFRKIGDQYYGSWISPYKIDVFSITGLYYAFGKLPVENLKQETVAKHMGIEYDAHKSYEDINACREVFWRCAKPLMEWNGSLCS